MSRWKKISSLVQKKTFVTTLQRTSYTFTPNKDEAIESRFRLRYSTTCNSYYRDWFNTIDPSSKGVIPGWEKALYSVESVRRHINEDIGQVYLERIPGSSTGCIKWRMDFGCSGLLVDEVTMRLSCVEDYGGEIIITLMGSPGHKRLRYAVGSDYVTYTELENSPELVVSVHLVGDAGQVTKLFPQNILRGMGYPLDIQVTLKPPFQSLGHPRILVGLMYSSSQEIEVDVRHYKENTSQHSGRGFLHIHLYRGRDLPQAKNSLPETFTKCYLLPDAKKTTKCKTKARKGKDPYWNEQFLVVDINYHEIKRRALEIYVADSKTSVGRRARFIGGVRLSLGYNAVVSAQTKKVNQVLQLLKGKGGIGGEITHSKDETGDGRDGHAILPQMGKISTIAPKWSEASFARMVIETATEKSNEQAGEEKENRNVQKNKTSTNGDKMEFFSLKNRNDKRKDIDATGTDKARMVFENAKKKLNEQADEEKANWNAQTSTKSEKIHTREVIDATGTQSQPQSLSSMLSTEEQTLACQSSLTIHNSKDDKMTVPEGNFETQTLSTDTVQNTEEMSEARFKEMRSGEEERNTREKDEEDGAGINEAVDSNPQSLSCTTNTKEGRETCETVEEIGLNTKSEVNQSLYFDIGNDYLKIIQENSETRMPCVDTAEDHLQCDSLSPSAEEQSVAIQSLNIKLEESLTTLQLENRSDSSNVQDSCGIQMPRTDTVKDTQEISQVSCEAESDGEEKQTDLLSQQQQLSQSMASSIKQLEHSLSTEGDEVMETDCLSSSLGKEDHGYDGNEKHANLLSQKLFQRQQLSQSMASSIKQLEHSLSTECDEVIESDCLISSLGKEDHGNELNTCNENKDLDEGLSTMKACQSENGIAECTDSDEKEKNVNEMKVETPVNYNLGKKCSEIDTATNKSNIWKNEKEDETFSNLSINIIGPEIDQQSEKQSGIETNVVQAEKSGLEKTVKKDQLLNNVPKQMLGGLGTKETIPRENTTESVSPSKQEEGKFKDLGRESNAARAERQKAGSDLSGVKRSPSFALKDLGKKLNLRRRSRSNEDVAKGSEKSLETGANKIMLDAQGLEITQWNLMVERPKQWHYCWHILRSEMTLLH
ncbi:uro-adherence factor A-like isoform X1 [Montipora foliosa]|uniref:uro-adherence factor A-like isoform X1 n=1 Tax=Montipora foliosa TaxID=591990 RepID=UPI0035F1C8B5